AKHMRETHDGTRHTFRHGVCRKAISRSSRLRPLSPVAPTRYCPAALLLTRDNTLSILGHSANADAFHRGKLFR
ncbi:MAG: hypothetical protein ACI81O_001276, partial [Cyclobacteriaceae bacterium]